MSQYFSQKYTVKWSDVDPNNHLRGSVYLDYADHTRVAFLDSQGITMRLMAAKQIGPILFNSSMSYRKEIYMNETITVNCKLDYVSADNRKFGISHEVFNQKGELSCIIKIEGAWLDLKHRKVAVPPSEIAEVMKKMNQVETT